MKIAVFDSGFGGLSLLSRAKKEIKGAQFIYFADNQNAPYGTKSKGEIIELCMDALSFLVAQKADMIVVACNTATSAAIAKLRARFNLPIVGMEPAVKLGQGYMGDILVIATPATIAGAKLSELIKRSNLDSKTHLLPMPRLVEFAQKMEFEDAAVSEYIKEQFAKVELNKIDLLVLGCTHFNYFKDSLAKALPKGALIVDGVSGTIMQMKRKIAELGGLETGKEPGGVEYFSSKIKKDASELEPFLVRLEKMEG